MWLQRLTLSISTLALPLVIYFLFSAPAFIIAVHSCEYSTNRIVRKAYSPLFRVAPVLTGHYMNLCGVSDIEFWFVLEAAQGDS